LPTIAETLALPCSQRSSGNMQVDLETPCSHTSSSQVSTLLRSTFAVSHDLGGLSLLEPSGLFQPVTLMGFCPVECWSCLTTTKSFSSAREIALG
jgi:hypothetical protein